MTASLSTHIKAAFLCACCATAGCDVFGLGTSGPELKGEFSGSLVYTTTGNVACHTTYSVTGTVQVPDNSAAGAATGEAKFSVTEKAVSWDPPPCGGPASDRNWDGTPALSGTTPNIQFAHEYTASGVVNLKTTTTFQGTRSADVVTGSITISHHGTGVVNGSTIVDDGTATFSTTLRR